MKLNLSEEWYAREFRKDAEEPATSITVGRADVQIPPIETSETSATQEENKRVHETTLPSTSLSPHNTPS